VLNPAGFRWGLFDELIRTFVIPLKARVLARGEPFVLVACYVGFRPTSAYQQRNPAEYVEFMLTVLNHLREKFNVVPDIWEVRLEPDHGRTQISGKEQGQLLLAAAQAARAAGYDKLMFDVPSTVVPHRTVEWLRGVLSVEGTAPFIREVTYHRYSPPTKGMLNAIRDTAEGRGYPTAMLEYLKASEHDLFEDLTEANVSAWARFSLAGPFGGPERGGQYYFADTARRTFRYRSTTWPLRQYFHYVRPGAVRIAATTRNQGIEPVAFRRPDGRMVMVANVSGAADVLITGLRPDRYRLSYSTEKEPGTLGPILTSSDGSLNVRIPAKGTLTLSPDDPEGRATGD
jgi:hypothetical protein